MVLQVVLQVVLQAKQAHEGAALSVSLALADTGSATLLKGVLQVVLQEEEVLRNPWCCRDRWIC